MMQVVLESKRFKFLEGQCSLTGDPRRLLTELALSPLKNSSASFDIKSPGEFNLEVAGVRAVDLRSGESVRIAYGCLGMFSVTEEDLVAAKVRIDADRGAVVRVNAVDSRGRPQPDCRLSLLLAGRTVMINPAEHGHWLLCSPYESWLMMEGMKTPVALPTESTGEDRVITLTPSE